MVAAALEAMPAAISTASSGMNFPGPEGKRSSRKIVSIVSAPTQRIRCFFSLGMIEGFRSWQKPGGRATSS